MSKREIIERLKGRYTSTGEINRGLPHQPPTSDPTQVLDATQPSHIIIRIITFPFIVIKKLFVGLIWLIYGLIIGCLGWVPGAFLGVLIGSVLGLLGKSLSDRISSSNSVADIAFYTAIAGGFLSIIKLTKSTNKKTAGFNKFCLVVGVLLGFLILFIVVYAHFNSFRTIVRDLF